MDEVSTIAIDSRNFGVTNATSGGDVIHAHFNNNKYSDPLAYMPTEYRQEFKNRLNIITDNFSNYTTVNDVLIKLQDEYGMSIEVSAELQSFHNGLVSALQNDAHTVYIYYRDELNKARNLSPSDQYFVQNVIEASQSLWDVTCIHLGIANDLQIQTRDERDPLCDALIDQLTIHVAAINVGVIAGTKLGAQIGSIIGGPIGGGVGAVLGAIGGGILGWFAGDSITDRQFEECERCLPPTSLFIETDECSFIADFTPENTGINVTQLEWSSDQTIPATAVGGRDETQTFEHIQGSGSIEFVIEATCVFQDEEINLSRPLSGGSIEFEVLRVPANALVAAGNNEISIPVENGQITGQPVTVTYQFQGLAVNNPDFSYALSGSVINGSIISNTSNSITIRWFPSNVNDFILTEWAWGSFQYTITNNCPGGQSRIYTFQAIINGSDNQI